MAGLRTSDQNRLAHALFGQLARAYSFEGEHLTAAEFKMVLCCYFEAALAESDGRPMCDIPLPESTSKMDVDRMNNFIEYIFFIGATIGIDLSD